MTGDRDTAFDLAQETFVSAWEHLDGFRGEARFENWLYRIASNKALNHLSRGTVSRTVSLDGDDLELAGPAGQSSPDQILERARLREDVLGFMAQLPPQQRLVFELRFYKQMNFGEIAAATGKALGTVKTNYREAVAKLRLFAREKGWHA